MAVLTLSELREHNTSFKKDGLGIMPSLDVVDTYKSEIPQFAKTVSEMRSGQARDTKGNKIKPIVRSFEEEVKSYFKVDVKTFLTQLGIYTESMSLSEVCSVLGCDTLNRSSFEKMMLDHSSGLDFSGIGSTANTSQVNITHRFIIPELIISAIRTGYIHASLSTNWIANTQSIGVSEITMPQIKRGDGVASKIAEGANIPLGSIQFGQKKAKVYKVGTGFKITDELLFQSALDILFIYLQEVGNEMAISADVVALDVLLNGEQTDGSESAPVIGVENIGTFAYKDMKRAFTRGKRLSQPYSRLITGEEDGIDITGIDKFEGFDGNTKLSSVRSIIGVPEVFDIDTHVPPADQIVFLSPERALLKLSFMGMKTESRRNVQNQTEELFVSDFIGFAIIKRDARLIMDKSVSFALVGFPDYMDIDSRIAQAFGEF